MELWEQSAVDESAVLELQKQLKIKHSLCRLLVQRGIHTYEKAEAFFRPKLEHLHDPYLMKDMLEAVARLEKAVVRKEKIMIFGDYDVDGTTSVALFYSFLSDFYKNIDFYFPDRYKEGYGVSFKGIDFAVENGFTLMIALDCGIRSVEQVAYAKEKGLDFIICDHHIPGAELPKAAAVLDPKRTDCPYPYKELSGCGIGFKLAQAFFRHRRWHTEKLWPLLAFTAVSIACDIVDMMGENRIMTYFGLREINGKNAPMGIRALLDEAKIKGPVSVSDMVFAVGPMLNAAGRMADAREAAKLLLSTDWNAAQNQSSYLKRLNDERRSTEREVSKQAIEQVAADPDAGLSHVAVAYSPEWHKGVLGIVASRVSEHFRMPAIVLTLTDTGIAVGSARSYKGFDMHDALSHCSHLLTHYGGHAFAAGMGVAPTNLPAFKKELNEYISKHIEQAPHSQKYDLQLPLPEIHNPLFWKTLKEFEPFGPGNMRPLIMSQNLQDNGRTRLSKDEKHLLLSLRGPEGSEIDGVAFWQPDWLEALKSNQPVDVCYVLEDPNEYSKGKVKMEARAFRLSEV